MGSESLVTFWQSIIGDRGMQDQLRTAMGVPDVEERALALLSRTLFLLVMEIKFERDEAQRKTGSIEEVLGGCDSCRGKMVAEGLAGNTSDTTPQDLKAKDGERSPHKQILKDNGTKTLLRLPFFEDKDETQLHEPLTDKRNTKTSHESQTVKGKDAKTHQICEDKDGGDKTLLKLPYFEDKDETQLHEPLTDKRNTKTTHESQTVKEKHKKTHRDKHTKTNTISDYHSGETEIHRGGTEENPYPGGPTGRKKQKIYPNTTLKPRSTSHTDILVPGTPGTMDIVGNNSMNGELEGTEEAFVTQRQYVPESVFIDEFKAQDMTDIFEDCYEDVTSCTQTGAFIPATECWDGDKASDNVKDKDDKQGHTYSGSLSRGYKRNESNTRRSKYKEKCEENEASPEKRMERCKENEQPAGKHTEMYEENKDSHAQSTKRDEENYKRKHKIKTDEEKNLGAQGREKRKVTQMLGDVYTEDVMVVSDIAFSSPRKECLFKSPGKNGAFVSPGKEGRFRSRNNGRSPGREKNSIFLSPGRDDKTLRSRRERERNKSPGEKNIFQSPRHQDTGSPRRERDTANRNTPRKTNTHTSPHHHSTSPSKTPKKTDISTPEGSPVLGKTGRGSRQKHQSRSTTGVTKHQSPGTPAPQTSTPVRRLILGDTQITPSGKESIACFSPVINANDVTPSLLSPGEGRGGGGGGGDEANCEEGRKMDLRGRGGRGGGKIDRGKEEREKTDSGRGGEIEGKTETGGGKRESEGEKIEAVEGKGGKTEKGEVGEKGGKIEVERGKTCTGGGKSGTGGEKGGKKETGEGIERGKGGKTSTGGGKRTLSRTNTTTTTSSSSSSSSVPTRKLSLRRHHTTDSRQVERTGGTGGLGHPQLHVTPPDPHRKPEYRQTTVDDFLSSKKTGGVKGGEVRRVFLDDDEAFRIAVKESLQLKALTDMGRQLDQEEMKEGEGKEEPSQGLTHTQAPNESPVKLPNLRPAHASPTPAPTTPRTAKEGRKARQSVKRKIIHDKEEGLEEEVAGVSKRKIIHDKEEGLEEEVAGVSKRKKEEEEEEEEEEVSFVSALEKVEENVSPSKDGGRKIRRPFYDSFDTLPQKEAVKFAHQGEVVRGRGARKQLEGWSCKQCREFYEKAGNSTQEVKELMNKCSRHRSKYKPLSNTPEGFWNPFFDP